MEVALHELDAVGVRDVQQIHGGKHPQLRWQANGALRVYTLPGSPSDVRASRNVRAEIRRLLREDGLLATPERPEPEPAPPPPKIDRFAELERRVAALEEWKNATQTTSGRD
jgi:hypothetical protein